MTHDEFWAVVERGDYRSVYFLDGSGFAGIVRDCSKASLDAFHITADSTFSRSMGPGDRWPSSFDGTIGYDQIVNVA